MPPKISLGRTLKIYRLFAISLFTGPEYVGRPKSIRKNSTICCGRHKERISKIKDHWSGDSLWIPMETCKFFTLEVEQFFKRLFKNLGLPTTGLTREP